MSIAAPSVAASGPEWSLITSNSSGALEAVQHVAQLPERASDPLARRDRVHVRELGLRVRVAGGEQRRPRARCRRGRPRAARRPIRCRRSRVGGTGNQHGARTAILIRRSPPPFRPCTRTSQLHSKARTPDSRIVAGPVRQLEPARPTRAGAVRGPAAGRAAPGAAARACRPPTPAAAPPSGRRSETASRSGAVPRRPRAAGSRSGATLRASAARFAAPPASARSARAPSAMSELSCGHTVPLWYESGLYAASASDIVRTPQPDQSPSPISWSTTASTRSGGTIRDQSRCPMFEQTESTRSLLAVERERVEAAAIVATRTPRRSAASTRPPRASRRSASARSRHASRAISASRRFAS